MLPMSLDRILSMDIEWVLYHLIHNDPEFKHLSLDVDFYDDDVWSRLLASLSRNSTIVSAKIERYQGGEGSRTFEELRDLFVALADISSIESLTISAVSSDDFLAALPLLRHQNLQICHLDWTGVENESVPLQVGRALSEAPNLRNLFMEDPRAEECELWLSQICRSSSLETLKVDTYRGISKLQQEAGAIFESLENNVVLRDFSLGFPLDEEVSSRLVRMIRRNSTLETIRLTLLSSEEQCYLDILDALKHNKSLSLFENFLAGAVGVSVEVQGKQHEMLKRQTSLEYFSLFREDDEFRKGKTMYLKLNTAGRSRLFEKDATGKETATPVEWLDVMGAASDSLDCLYHCLSMNPSLCRSAAEVRSTTNHTGKRKR